MVERGCRRRLSELRRTRRQRMLACLVPLGLAAVVIAGCGSSSSSSSSATGSNAAATASTGSGSSSSGTDAAYLARVKAVVQGGETGFLYDPEADLAGPLNPNDMVILKPGQWRGPTSAPKAAKGIHVEVISCAAGSACDGAADGVIDAGHALGWTVHYSASDGTPSGDVRAFDAAIARHPNAIVGVALSQSVLGQPMAAAHAAGIKVVGIALPHLMGPPNGYDQTAPAPEGAATQVQQWIAIADSNGKAKIGYMWDTASGTLGAVLPIAQKQLTDCSGCSQVPAVNHAYATASDPVSMARLTSSLIDRSPGLGYILTPYGEGVPGIISGVKQSPNPNVKVISQNGEVEEVAAVHSGQLFADVGFSLNQMGWTGVDALVRLLAGKPALPVQDEGVVLHIFTQSNAPANGNFNWAAAFPYEQNYEKAWGVG
jgi:ABC-type sugar transport system substrate-binding protein